MSYDRLIELFATAIKEKDSGARETNRLIKETDGYTEVEYTFSHGGRATLVIDVSDGEDEDPVVEAQDANAESTNSLQFEDLKNFSDMSQIIDDAFEWGNVTVDDLR